MMETAILPTKGVLIRSKLERPPLPARLVARPRLIERLDQARDGRATLIDAPRGYGKTTLALQWLSHSGLASAWVALDEADRDPGNRTGISYREVESVVYGISFAGHDRVTALLCNTLMCLLPRRDQWEEVVADRSLIPNAIEESLRFESPQVSWRRITTCDTTLGGVGLPAGTRLFLNLAAANHQPDLFDGPETFDLHRPNATRNISFGKGIHFCLGMSLAKMEARITLDLLAEMVPGLRLLDGQPLDYFPNITFRGPNALVVDWD